METDDQVPIAKILRAVSAQLDALGMQVTNLENYVGQVVTPNLNLPDQVIRELQVLDRIRQSMQDLAAITGKLAKNVGNSSLPHSEIDQSRSDLQLSTSRATLKGELDPDLGKRDAPEASKLTLF